MVVDTQYFNISYFNRQRTSTEDKKINFAAGGNSQLFFMHEQNFDTFYASALCDYSSTPDSRYLYLCN
jgi:hypothetical protein